MIFELIRRPTGQFAFAVDWFGHLPAIFILKSTSIPDLALYITEDTDSAH